MPMVFIPDVGKAMLFGGQLDSRQFQYSDAIWLYDAAADQWEIAQVLGSSDPGSKRTSLPEPGKASELTSMESRKGS